MTTPTITRKACRRASCIGRIFCGLTLLALSSALAAHPAFPGAEGFGALATGGRFGDVYYVENLSVNAATPGSFAYGLATAPASGRTILFEVAGYIPINGNLHIVQPNLTIAGQTAPGDGIGLQGGAFWIEKTNVIVRHVRIRNGVGGDCIDLGSTATNVILDHCDALFGTDENFSSFGSPPENLTFQWSFNAWGLSPHSAGGLWYMKRATSHHSLWAHNHTRDPKALPSGLLDWINNVTFDYGIGFIMADSTETASYKANVEGCYFICPPGNTRPYALSRAGVDSNGVPNFSLWLTNCLWDTDGDYLLDGTDPGWGMVSVAPNSYYRMTSAIPRVGGIPVTQDSPLVAYKKMVSQGGPLRLDAGHSGGLRDEVAQVLIRSLLSQQHQRFTNVSETGAPNNGYGILSATLVSPDTDRDGLPDYWETTLGSNPDADDHTNQVAAGAFVPSTPAGYTLLDEYLHFRATPHALILRALTNRPSALAVDLRRYTSGFTNKVPFSYLISDVSTGAVALSNSTVAVFTPPIGFSGRASFTFSVTDGDGSSWAQPFYLFVSAVPLPRSLVWNGDGAANLWDLSAPAFWPPDDTNRVAFLNGDGVTVNDNGSNSPAIVLAGSLRPSFLVVSNAVKNFTIGGSGTLKGAMSLAKAGAAVLTLTNAHSFHGGTTIAGGTLALGTKVANNGALGSGGLVLSNAALLELFGANSGDIDGTGVGTFTPPITVPAGTSASLHAPFRYTLASSLAGGGTLNLRVTGVRGDISGNGAAFTGQLNVSSRSGTSDFRVANTAGYPSARLHLSTNVLMYSRTSGGAVIPIGAFSAAPGAVVSAGMGTSLGTQNEVTWLVGGLNIDATNSATIQGTTKLVKSGTGTWTLTAANTFSGGLVVSNGTVIIQNSTGSGTGSGAVRVCTDATLAGSGTVGGIVIIEPGGTLAPGPGIGRLMISNSLSLATNVVTVMELNRTLRTNDSIVCGSVSYGGTLLVTNLSGPIVAGDAFRLFASTNSTSTFSVIIGSPGVGLEWRFNPESGWITAASTLPPPAPTIAGLNITNGARTLSLSSLPGYTYTIQGSTNLVQWEDLYVTNPPTSLFSWSDTTLFPRRFYRALVE